MHEDKLTVTAPTAMFLKALDKLLDKMAEASFDFSKVVAIAGDTQVNKSINEHKHTTTVLPAKSDSDAMICL